MTVSLSDAARFAMNSNLSRNSSDPRASWSFLNVLAVLSAMVEDEIEKRVRAGELKRV